jgi:hypothetical protein
MSENTVLNLYHLDVAMRGSQPCSFDTITSSNPTQARALELLGVKLNPRALRRVTSG